MDIPMHSYRQYMHLQFKTIILKITLGHFTFISDSV